MKKYYKLLKERFIGQEVRPAGWTFELGAPDKIEGNKVRFFSGHGVYDDLVIGFDIEAMPPRYNFNEMFMKETGKPLFLAGGMLGIEYVYWLENKLEEYIDTSARMAR